MSAPDQTSKRRRWLWPVLVVSLAVNLLVAGMVVGAVLRDDARDRPPGSARSLIGEPFVRALEPEDRRAFLRGMLADRDTLRSNRADLRARVEMLLGAIAAEEFDREAVAGILAEQRSLAQRRQTIGEALLLDRLEAMSVEERQAYAQRLGDSLRHRKRSD